MFNLVFTAIDDTPLEAFVWMPAHSTADDVGSLLLGNEAPLSEVDRQSNARADAEAKAAVEAHRVPVEVRRRVKQEAKRVREAAMWLGRVTHLANSHADAPHRDSEGTRWKSRRTGSGGLRRHLQPRGPTVAAEQRPAALGGHVVFRQRSSWLCVVCWRSSSSWDKFAPQRCASSVAEHDSWGHCMMLSGDVHWCLRCGAYAQRKAKGLARPCPGPPGRWQRGGRALQLRALRQQRHPRTGEHLPDACPALLSADPAACGSAVSPHRAPRESRDGSLLACLEPLRARIVAKEVARHGVR